MSPDNLTALLLSFKLATLTTLLLLVICLPLAWWLSRSPSWLATFCKVLTTLPIVLPPSVIGFYLLIGFGGLATWTEGQTLAFSFTGILIGSMLYSLPFVIQPLLTSFQSIGRAPLELAASLGASPADRFFTVALPLARPGIISASLLGFAHTLGEFGVVLMIGGSLHGETRIASIALYERVESLHYQEAHQMAGTMLLLSLGLLVLVYRFGQKEPKNT